jgi:hypothetical protein
MLRGSAAGSIGVTCTLSVPAAGAPVEASTRLLAARSTAAGEFGAVTVAAWAESTCTAGLARTSLKSAPRLVSNAFTATV